jgi:flavin-dependent dehydrogenase
VTAPQKTLEHVVIGGGPAGSMAACLLAEAGHKVTLLERERGAHHKVCGEFLSREAVQYLHRIGVSPDALGASPIRIVRLSSGTSVAEAALPFPALSLSRLVLDEALLARAAAAGCNIQRGTCVEKLSVENGVWTARLNGGELLRARTVFLATGKHDLHGWNRTEGRQGDLVGFKLHWQLAPGQIEALRDSMELFLFPYGYGGLSLVERDHANLCLVVRRSRLRRVDGWTALLARILNRNRRMRELLQGASPLWPRPLAISPIPYGYLAPEPRGLWRLGDQVAVIPSFTGDGMSIALHSAALAVRMYLQGKTAGEYSRTLRSQLRKSMTLAALLSQAAVTRPGRHAAPAIFSLLPNMLASIAAVTRVPDRDLLIDNRAPIVAVLPAARPAP